MKISINDLIENSFVISIDDKRHLAFCEAFSNSGFLKMPLRIDGFQIHTTGSRAEEKHYRLPKLNFPIIGNSFTHAAIVKIGKTFNKDFVCIFEDDAYPCIDILNKLDDYLYDIPDDCSILKLGYNIIYDVTKSEMLRSKYLTNFKSWGCHAYIVFKKFYDNYMKLFGQSIVCDSCVFNDDNNILMTAENLFIQRTIHGNTKPINRLNNANVNQFIAEKLDLNVIRKQMHKTKFVYACNAIH